jgi:hypothetical protein
MHVMAHYCIYQFGGRARVWQRERCPRPHSAPLARCKDGASDEFGSVEKL